MRNSGFASPWSFFGLRVLAFLGVFAALQLGWQSLHGSAVEHALIHDGTVRPAAFLINLMTPTVQAHAIGFSIRAPGGGLNILNGCEGLEALFLLVAAFAVAPVTWRAKGLGLLIGVAVVFVVNQIRILLLFYAYRQDHTWFDALHGTVAPLAVVFLVAAYFSCWLEMARRHAQPA